MNIYDAVPPSKISVCLLGDSQDREYPVTYFGSADFPAWIREDEATPVGTVAVAMVRIGTDEDGNDEEALIAEHPDYGWCSAGSEVCRDFQPAIDDARLEKAA